MSKNDFMDQEPTPTFTSVLPIGGTMLIIPFVTSQKENTLHGFLLLVDFGHILCVSDSNWQFITKESLIYCPFH